MATPPPTSTPPKPVSLDPSNEDRPDTKEAVPESSPTSSSVNSEPIREEQVQNAMKFMLHPKVRGSPVMNIRSFLEGKGLTKEEIDEAFRRDTLTAAVSRTHPAISSQDGQIKPSLSVQQQPPTQVLQPVGSTSKIEMLSQFHGYHAILAVGLLAAAGAGTAVFFKVVASEEDDEDLIEKSDTKPSVAEEAAAAAKDAAVMALDLARASQEMSTKNIEERKCVEEIISTLHAQTQEMKSMINSIQKLESGICVDVPDNRRFSGTSSSQPYTSGTTYTNPRSGYLYRPMSAEPTHPKPHMEGINDAPPVPNQPLMDPSAAPRPKLWEGTQPSQESSDGTTQDNQLKGDDAVPGVESGEKHNSGWSNMPAVNDQPPQRHLVPPDDVPGWVSEVD
ncbi:hypothetical protein SASPL_138533 [Salvia splendens]|uniref:Peroxisomal membrane protein PEX14 n=1 Tax=Salvia splendens TaxID=180675 RepID=A0A8X8ZF49_SALSN|nr:hypothetical protein SASPL_138533 [Salvia splendens]